MLSSSLSLFVSLSLSLSSLLPYLTTFIYLLAYKLRAYFDFCQRNCKHAATTEYGIHHGALVGIF
jgi:hypothetical protein